MRKQTIQATLANGGRIQNHTLIDASNQPTQGKNSEVTSKQIQALVDAGEVSESIGYDRTRTYKAK